MILFFFFFKQKTAYEMRISDWSSDVCSSDLSINLGTSYVNDFNAFGRIYQVRAQADQQFRMERQDIDRLKVRSATDELVPLGTLVEIKDVSGPNLVQRYKMFVSVPVQGNAADRKSVVEGRSVAVRVDL